MSDDRTQGEVRGNGQIDINRGSERRNWAKRLSVTEDELTDAVRNTGASADKVRNYLQVKSFIRKLREYVKRRKGAPSS
jgi:hypothetical protein